MRTGIIITLAIILAFVPGAWGHYAPKTSEIDPQKTLEKLNSGAELSADEYVVLAGTYRVREDFDKAYFYLQKAYELEPENHHVAYGFSSYYSKVALYYGNPKNPEFDAGKVNEAREEILKWDAKGMESSPESLSPFEREQVEEWKRIQEGYYKNIKTNPISDATAGASKLLLAARENINYLLGFMILAVFVLLYSKTRYKRVPR